MSFWALRSSFEKHSSLCIDQCWAWHCWWQYRVLRHRAQVKSFLSDVPSAAAALVVHFGLSQSDIVCWCWVLFWLYTNENKNHHITTSPMIQSYGIKRCYCGMYGPSVSIVPICPTYSDSSTVINCDDGLSASAVPSKGGPSSCKRWTVVFGSFCMFNI